MEFTLYYFTLQYGYNGRMDAKSLDKFLAELRELMPLMMVQDNFDESLVCLLTNKYSPNFT